MRRGKGGETETRTHPMVTTRDLSFGQEAAGRSFQSWGELFVGGGGCQVVVVGFGGG